MPESDIAARPRPADVVRDFYAALDTRDALAISRIIESIFDADTTVEFPASLPYGGRVVGARRLSRMFGAMANGDAGVGPKTVDVLDVVGAGPRVIALLDFDWFPSDGGEPVTTSACEVWEFAGDRVLGIRAYYWDTAALVART